MARKSLLLSLALILVGTLALAHAGVKNPAVMARMESMVVLKDNIDALVKMVKGEAPFDRDGARARIATIAIHAAETPKLFEKEETDPKSEAFPVIWEQFDDFTVKSDALQAEAASLSGSVETEADLRTGLTRMGVACLACHDVYRK